MAATKVTPEQALEDLAASTQKQKLVIPTKAAQVAWFEQWVVRKGGTVVYSCKTWNPDAERLARARAELCGGDAGLVGQGRTGEKA